MSQEKGSWSINNVTSTGVDATIIQKQAFSNAAVEIL